jgi:putative transposase
MTASARSTVAEPGRNVRQKAGLNRVIPKAGWHGFATILTYKMEERSGQVVTVPARFTSQTCGVVDAKSRSSSDSESALATQTIFDLRLAHRSCL